MQQPGQGTPLTPTDLAQKAGSTHRLLLHDAQASARDDRERGIPLDQLLGGQARTARLLVDLGWPGTMGLMRAQPAPVAGTRRHACVQATVR